MGAATTVRQIVAIDEELCNGCGVCVTPCAEGAIVLENGKARVRDEALCDGAGFCIPFDPEQSETLIVTGRVPGPSAETGGRE
jgi:MinD superfamily P-loop ATPase